MGVAALVGAGCFSADSHQQASNLAADPAAEPPKRSSENLSNQGGYGHLFPGNWPDRDRGSGKGRAVTPSSSFYLSEQQIAQKTAEADGGDADAAFALHLYYSSHSWFASDYETQASEWLGRAVELEHPGAQFDLGYFSLNNDDESDDGEALRLIRRSAEAGNQMAKLYLESLGVNGERH